MFGIELAVVLYAGAHIQSFDIDLIGKDISTFRVLQKFKYHDDALNQLDRFSPIFNGYSIPLSLALICMVNDCVYHRLQRL